MKKRMAFSPKVWIEVLDYMRWIVGWALVIILPFAWILRDGLKPGFRESTGFAAVFRVLSFLGGWVVVLAILFVVLSVAVRRLRRRYGDVTGVAEAMVTTTLARGVIQTLALLGLLCLLGAAVFASLGDKNKQRRTAEYQGHAEYMDAALEKMIPSLSFAPPATFGDAIEFFDKCVLNCLCKDGHDGKGKIRVIANIDEELLQKPMVEIRATDIKTRDALRLVCESACCRWEVDSSARTITIYELQGCVLPVKRTAEPHGR